MAWRIVIMGVSGCGKSSVGAAVAADQGLPLVEGDDFHGAANRDKMARGIALDDEDRAQWLATLGEQLAAHPQGVVLACSALKRAYREVLRRPAPGLRFVFLDLPIEEAKRRVARRGGHFFSPSLVESQFATLESPVGEEGVLRVDAMEPIAEITREVARWLRPSLDPPGSSPGQASSSPG